MAKPLKRKNPDEEAIVAQDLDSEYMWTSRMDARCIDYLEQE
jgi:hypothetical protein